MGRAFAARAWRWWLRAGETGADARNSRCLCLCSQRFREQRAGFRQCRAVGFGRQRRTEAALDVSIVGRKTAQRVLNDRAGRSRRRPDPADHPGRTGRRRMGDQRPQMVHVQRLDGRFPDCHGGHRSGRGTASAGVDDRRTSRHSWSPDPARHPDHGAPVRTDRRARWACRDHLRGCPCAGGKSDRGGRRRFRTGAEAAGTGPDPPLHALARPVAPSVRHALRAGGQPLCARVGAGRQTARPGLGGQLRGECRPPG